MKKIRAYLIKSFGIITVLTMIVSICFLTSSCNKNGGDIAEIGNGNLEPIIGSDSALTITGGETVKQQKIPTNDPLSAEEIMDGITVDDFQLTVTVEKTGDTPEDTIEIVARLKNISGRDVYCQIPDWIAANIDGKGIKKDIKYVIQLYTNHADEEFTQNVFMIGVWGRPRVIFYKDETIERTFCYKMSEWQDGLYSGSLDIYICADFFIIKTGIPEERINIKSDPIKIRPQKEI